MFMSSVRAAFLNPYLPLPLMTRVRWKVLIRKVLVMPYAPSSCYYLPLMTKYFPWQRVCRFNPYIFSDGPRFKPNVSIVFINQDNNHHHCHHFSKELLRYSSVCFVFLCMCTLCCPLLCVLIFRCFCYWLLNQLINVIIVITLTIIITVLITTNNLIIILIIQLRNFIHFVPLTRRYELQCSI